MKKTLYSLMLSDDVVREIDNLAHRMGTSRSNLVNTILAERVQLRTPEQQISDVFDGIEQLLAGSRELIPLITPNTPSMALRSSLEYKYRPTVRYEVELSNGFIPGEPIGTLTASFRTQSQALLELIGRFFRCLQRIENRLLPIDVSYSLDQGRFVRTLAYPTLVGGGAHSRVAMSPAEISEAITDYVRLIDRLLKACVGGADSAYVMDEYAEDLEKRKLLI